LGKLGELRLIVLALARTAGQSRIFYRKDHRLFC
jgi:hypothetical protein